MVPEIALLSEHFTGQVWDKTTQVAFMECLRDENFFNGNGANDPAFSARDRIKRKGRLTAALLFSSLKYVHTHV